MILTAQAQTLEDGNPERALALANEAHTLALDLVEAAAIAGRIYSSRGQTAKVARVIEQTWKRAPHPDLATATLCGPVTARARSARAREEPGADDAAFRQAPIAVASTAIGPDWAGAQTLTPLLEGRLSQRVHADGRIEGEQFGVRARARMAGAGRQCRAIPPGPPTASSPNDGCRSHRSPARSMRSMEGAGRAGGGRRGAGARKAQGAHRSAITATRPSMRSRRARRSRDRRGRGRAPRTAPPEKRSACTGTIRRGTCRRQRQHRAGHPAFHARAAAR